MSGRDDLPHPSLADHRRRSGRRRAGHHEDLRHRPRPRVRRVRSLVGSTGECPRAHRDWHEPSNGRDSQNFRRPAQAARSHPSRPAAPEPGSNQNAIARPGPETRRQPPRRKGQTARRPAGGGNTPLVPRACRLHGAAGRTSATDSWSTSSGEPFTATRFVPARRAASGVWRRQAADDAGDFRRWLRRAAARVAMALVIGAARPEACGPRDRRSTTS